MSRRTALFFLVAAAGFFLYLWPALRAPVVLWSDSALDLDWARRGVGIVSPVHSPPAGEEPQRHPAKPAYLLFLRAALALAPEGQEARTVVVIQSLLLWLSIVGTSFFLVRRRGWAGVVLLAFFLSFFRVRESASAVMPEALAAALLLPVAAIVLDPPRTRAWIVLFGTGIGLLFWVRPNVGGIALVLALVAAAVHRGGRGFAMVAAGFALLFLPIWFLTRPESGGPTLRGLSHPILEASADYYWSPTIELEATSPGELEGRELERAGSNWEALLRSRGTDARRQLVWRGLHGLLGTEFSDTRWSFAYSHAAEVSRAATPFVVLAAIAVALGCSPGNPGVLLAILLVGQSLLLGSNPRFVLPFLPMLCLFAMSPLTRVLRERRAGVLAGLVFVALVVFVGIHPFVLDREWGRIEAAGVKIRQQIPRRSLPRAEPATLHLRIAPPLSPSEAHLEIRDTARRLLYSSAQDPSRERPAISIPLPQVLLDENADRPIDLELTSFGTYGEVHYLLFPVIPPPWRRGAIRAGSAELSPSTGIRRGALDWWAHSGRD